MRVGGSEVFRVAWTNIRAIVDGEIVGRWRGFASFMNNVIKDRVCCPGCGQGWVVHVRVPRLNRELFVCEECESTWLTRENIGVNQALDFVEFMRSNGLKGLWTELERVAGN